MSQPVFEFYQNELQQASEKIATLSKTLKGFAWYRFFSFISLFLPFFIFSGNLALALALSAGLLSLFLFLVKKNAGLEKKRKWHTTLKKLAEDELKALNHDFSPFDGGEKFLNHEHPFSYDLDLFGQGSLFGFLNRTSTLGGSKKLASWLASPLLKKEEIIARQEAVKELATETRWKLYFRAKGQLSGETQEQNNEMAAWGKAGFGFKYSGVIRILIWLLPLLTVGSIILSVAGIANPFWKILIPLQWGILFLYRRRIKHYFSFFGQKSEILEKYMLLLETIENAKFKTPYLKKIQEKTNAPLSASTLFRKLRKRVKEFEYRQNILVGFVLDSLFLWDVRCVYLLWLWHSEFHGKIAGWLDAITEIDALVSLANYSGNHPGFVFPGIAENGYRLIAKQMGHPLLNPQKRVANDFEINGQPQVVIITGANMAGKSTFLRTAGVNLVLAGAGAPVCASEFEFTPTAIYTNMRTTDSLMNDESYFFAELKRLKGAFDRLNKGEAIFVILDEMLKGTNSADKLNGSRALIGKMLQTRAVALVATHDLKLSEMEGEFPGLVSNKCFEIRIENDELIFDYKLTDGVTRIMNATFLMKKMGLV